MVTNWWVWSTTLNGIPYGGWPKSGCRLVPSEFMDCSQRSLSGFTGRAEMSVFQMLLDGNIVQPVPGMGAPEPDDRASAPGPGGMATRESTASAPNTALRRAARILVPVPAPPTG